MRVKARFFYFKRDGQFVYKIILSGEVLESIKEFRIRMILVSQKLKA